MTGNAAAVFVLIALALFVVTFTIGPIFTIWALNLVFGLEIPLTFKTWVAVLWLTLVLHGVKASSSKS